MSDPNGLRPLDYYKGMADALGQILDLWQGLIANADLQAVAAHVQAEAMHAMGKTEAFHRGNGEERAWRSVADQLRSRQAELEEAVNSVRQLVDHNRREQTYQSAKGGVRSQ